MPIYHGITQVQVKRGDLVLFWKDDWNQSLLAEQYPRAFSYVLNEDLPVHGFLTAHALHETFQLPLSIQAHDELKLLQADLTAVTLEDCDDVWSY